MESAVSPACALPGADPQGQAQNGCDHRGGARTRRLHLGGQSGDHDQPGRGKLNRTSDRKWHIWSRSQGACAGAKVRPSYLVQWRERSRGKGNSRSSCEADQMIDARPQTATAPDGHTDMREPANKRMLTGVSGLRSYHCTIIASITLRGLAESQAVAPRPLDMGHKRMRWGESRAMRPDARAKSHGALRAARLMPSQ